MDSIAKIKQVVNSLDSVIEDENIQLLSGLLSGLGEEIGKQGNGGGTIVKMMQSMGRYLASKTHTAHPDTVPLLCTLADNLEILVNGQGESKAVKKEILARSIRAFKALKIDIAASSSLSDVELEKLKAVILSIDWEISDSTLDNLDRIITRLKEKLKSNKLHHTFLRILQSIGVHIKRNKAYADKNSSNLLQSVYLNYERMVLHPEMPLEEKKQMIEADIRAYNEFKRGLSSQPEPILPGVLSDDDLPPALSHVDSTPTAGGPATLSRLAEPSDEVEEITPALAGATAKASPPRDVMGDLFSPKTSPADELLDAIHLSELHGQEEPNPMGEMASAQGQEEGPGIKNFVPRRGGEVPIPEIENRLDEFFNLDVSENSMGQILDEDSDDKEPAAHVYSEEIELEPEEEEDEPGIVPDLMTEMVPDDGIELIEPGHLIQEDPIQEDPIQEDPIQEDPIQEDPIQEDSDQSFLLSELKVDPAEPVLARLKTILDAPSELAGETAFTQAIEDLSRLGQLWDPDMDKIGLVDLLTGLTRYIHGLDQPSRLGENRDGRPDDAGGMDDPGGDDSQGLLFRDDFPPADAEPVPGKLVSDEPLSESLPDDPLPDDSGSTETSLFEDEAFNDGEAPENDLEEDGLGEDMREEELLEVEKVPKGFWSKIKSIFRK